MTMIRTAGLLTGAATLSFSGFAVAADIDNASVDALRAELNDLRAQNDALEARVDAQDEEWLNDSRAAEVRGIVQDVLADSQTRTSLQDNSMSAGYKAGKGFFLSNQDGSFTMRIKGQVQVRWVMNYNKQDQVNANRTVGGVAAPQDNSPKTNWGFQVRRAKIKFQGNVVDPTWQYQVNGAFDSGNGGFQFEEVMITKDMENGFSLTFGQFKTPFTREELVSSSEQLAVERSVVNEFFNADRMLGIDAMYKTDNWSAEVAYGNGFGTQIYPGEAQRNTNVFTSPTRWSFAGRFQYKISGDWSDFDSFTSAPGDDQAIMIGVAAIGQQYNNNANQINNLNGTNTPLNSLLFATGIGDLNGSTVYGLTADASMKFGGLSIFGALTWMHYDVSGRLDPALVADNGFSASSVNPWGFVVQAGYSFTEQWEVFGRYGYANSNTADIDVTNGGVTTRINTPAAEISLITVGVNYFINSNVKFTADWGINLNSDLFLFSDSASSTGWDDSASSDQWVLRAQLQLLF